MERLWGFALAIVYVPGGFPQPAEMGRWTLVLLGPALFFPRRPQALLGLLAGWSLISLAWTQSFSSSLPLLVPALGQWLELVALIALVMSNVRLDEVFEGMAAGLVISVGLVALETLGWQSPLSETASPAGLFVNRELLAESAALVSVWAFLSRRWTLFMVLVAGVALCGSRLGLLVLATAVGWRLALPFLLGAGLLCLSAGAWTSLGGRLEGWQAALQLQTWRGLGLGFWENISAVGHLVHSEVLWLSSELGVVGLWLLLWWLMKKEWPNETTRRLGFAVALECVLSFPLHQPACAALCAVVAAQLVPCSSPLWRRLGIRRVGDEEGLASANA